MSTRQGRSRSTSIRTAVASAAASALAEDKAPSAIDAPETGGTGPSTAETSAPPQSSALPGELVEARSEASGEESQHGGDLRRIVRISIRNVLGIEFADLPVGDGLLFTGPNESSKTAILDSLRAMFDSNARTQMVRWGQGEGSVMLVLDDGTEARRRITDGEMQQPVLYRPDRTKVGAPVAALRKLAPAFLVNPVQFIKLEPAKQVKLLAKVFGVQPHEGEIEAICGDDVDLREVSPDADGLTKVTEAYDAAYHTRHGANAELARVIVARDAERAKIPAGFDADEVRSVSTETLAKELAEVTQHNQHVRTGIEQLAELHHRQAVLTTEMQQCEARLQALRTQGEALRGRINEGTEWAAKFTYIDPASLTAKIQSLDAQRALLSAYDMAAQLDVKVEDAQARARRLQQVVQSLNALKVELVQRAAIPIEGLTLDPAGIRVRGLPLNNLSQGAQYTVAIRVAAAGATELRIICIDGIEALSRDTRQQILAELAELRFQVFMTQVSDVDFAVFDLNGQPVDATIKMAPVAQITRGPGWGSHALPNEAAEGALEGAGIGPTPGPAAALSGETAAGPEPMLFSESRPPEPEANPRFGALSI